MRPAELGQPSRGITTIGPVTSSTVSKARVGLVSFQARAGRFYCPQCPMPLSAIELLVHSCEMHLPISVSAAAAIQIAL